MHFKGMILLSLVLSIALAKYTATPCNALQQLQHAALQCILKAPGASFPRSV